MLINCSFILSSGQKDCRTHLVILGENIVGVFARKDLLIIRFFFIDLKLKLLLFNIIFFLWGNLFNRWGLIFIYLIRFNAYKILL